MNRSSQPRWFTASFALAVTLAVVAVSSPLASYSLLGSVRDVESEPTVMQQQARKSAIRDRNRVLLQRRWYNNALDDCVEKRRADRELECPDFNDVKAYESFMPTTDSSWMHSFHGAARTEAGAEVKGVTSLKEIKAAELKERIRQLRETFRNSLMGTGKHYQAR